MKKFLKWVGIFLNALPTRIEQGSIDTIRMGITPDGREVRGESMPRGSDKSMDDVELQAVWVYLQSLPELEYGKR